MKYIISEGVCGIIKLKDMHMWLWNFECYKNKETDYSRMIECFVLMNSRNLKYFLREFNLVKHIWF